MPESVAWKTRSSDYSATSDATLSLVIFSAAGGVGTQARPVLDALSSLAKDTLEFESANTLEVQDLSITYHSGPTCSCDNIGPAPDGPSCIAALRRKVYALRLWACKLMCGHLRLVMAFMLVQIALLGLWIVILLSQPRGASKGRRSRSVSPVKRPGRSQFVVHAADYADPELGRPLLRADE